MTEVQALELLTKLGELLDISTNIETHLVVIKSTLEVISIFVAAFLVWKMITIIYRAIDGVFFGGL